MICKLNQLKDYRGSFLKLLVCAFAVEQNFPCLAIVLISFIKFVLRYIQITIMQCVICHVDCFLSARSREPKSLSPFQEKELLSSFLNNKELTKDMMNNLSYKLGITPTQVKFFFQMQSKKPRNVSMEPYPNLLQGKGLKYIVY